MQVRSGAEQKKSFEQFTKEKEEHRMNFKRRNFIRKNIEGKVFALDFRDFASSYFLKFELWN